MPLLFLGHLHHANLVNYIVALGSNRTIENIDFTPPPDSRAGYRITSTVLQQEGDSPGTGGGPIDPWNGADSVIAPSGFTPSDFEYKWDAISSTVDTEINPSAEDTYEDLGSTVTWEGRMSSDSTGSRVFDVTVREKADFSNIDTMRVTINVEGQTA